MAKPPTSSHGPSKMRQRVSNRRKGNQGDFGTSFRERVGTLPEHEDHNAEIERKKAEKRKRKNESNSKT